MNISAFTSRNEFHANLTKTEIRDVSESTKIRRNEMQLKTYIPQNNNKKVLLNLNGRFTTKILHATGHTERILNIMQMLQQKQVK